MSEMKNISQNASLGAKGNTFVAEQHNYNGLSPQDAFQMAFSMFKEYYPQLRQNALEEVHRIVERELQKVSKNDIQPPTAKIVVPLLQNASITDDTELREMYGKLLAGDMNKQLKQYVHPAYVAIVNQMSCDDAMLFHKICEINNSIPVASIKFTFESKYLTLVFPRFFSPFFADMDPWKVSLCIENLSRLNIIHLFEGNVISYDYEKIKQEPFVIDRFEFAKENNASRELSIKMDKYVIQINDFGRGLSKLCF